MTCSPDKNWIDRWTYGYINKISIRKRVFFTHAQIHNGRIDFNQILHIHCLGGRNNTFESPSKLVQGFWKNGVRNLAPLTLALASNTAYCATAHTRDKRWYGLKSWWTLVRCCTAFPRGWPSRCVVHFPAVWPTPPCGACNDAAISACCQSD